MSGVARSRIVAIEPDAHRGRLLKELLLECGNVDVVVPSSADAAIRAMADEPTDLLITSALISPSDDVRLSAALRQQPDLWHVPVLTVPPVVESGPASAEEPARGRFLSFLGRARPVWLSGPTSSVSRSAPSSAWPSYDRGAVLTRIRETLEASRLARESRPLDERPALVFSDSPRQLQWDNAGDAERRGDPCLDDRADRDVVIYAPGNRNERAPRLCSSAVPWLSSVKLSWGLEVELLNISSSGLLIESGARFTAGGATEFVLRGTDGPRSVRARFVRSRVSSADAPGVRYQTAAVFESRLELGGLPDIGRIIGSSPEALGDVLAWIKEQALLGVDQAHLRAGFELHVQRLVVAQDVRIFGLADLPRADDSAEGDSVSLAVPTGNASPSILRAIFHPDHQPRGEEFEMLRAAASMATRVLEIERGT